MLPGFRFLLATTLLTTSLVIFGLGAASLLKNAYQETSKPALLRALRDPFPPPPVEVTLALTRVDPAPPALDPAPAAPAEPSASAGVAEPPANAEAAAPVQAALTDNVTPPVEAALAPATEAAIKDESAKEDATAAPAPLPVAEIPAADPTAEAVKAAAGEAEEMAAATPGESRPIEAAAPAPPAETGSAAETEVADPVVTAALPGQTEAVPLPTRRPLVKNAGNNARAAQIAKARKATQARAAAARRQAAAAAAAKQQNPFGL